MNAWSHTDVDDIRTCGSHIDEHMANMRDKIGNSYGYKVVMFVAILILAINMWNNCRAKQSCNEKK